MHKHQKVSGDAVTQIMKETKRVYMYRIMIVRPIHLNFLWVFQSRYTAKTGFVP